MCCFVLGLEVGTAFASNVGVKLPGNLRAFSFPSPFNFFIFIFIYMRALNWTLLLGLFCIFWASSFKFNLQIQIPSRQQS